MVEAYQNPNQELAFDLRQGYAKTVQEHIDNVSYARIRDIPYYWFKSLNDLYIVISFKFKDGKDLEEYKRLKSNFNILANKFPHVATTTGSSNPNEKFLLDKVLEEIEILLWKVMHEAKMFGEGQRTAGLM